MDADRWARPGTRSRQGSPILAAIKATASVHPVRARHRHQRRPAATDRARSRQLIRVCKEDECIGITSGLYYCKALSLIQYTGFLDSINAIRGVAVSTASRSA
jgi:hypothetical protein